MVDIDAALGEQFLDIAVGQPVAQVPAHATMNTSAGKRKPATPSKEATKDETERRTSPVNPACSSDQPTQQSLLKCANANIVSNGTCGEVTAPRSATGRGTSPLPVWHGDTTVTRLSSLRLR
jgi:hypothetical protein